MRMSKGRCPSMSAIKKGKNIQKYLTKREKTKFLYKSNIQGLKESQLKCTYRLQCRPQYLGCPSPTLNFVAHQLLSHKKIKRPKKIRLYCAFLAWIISKKIKKLQPWLQYFMTSTIQFKENIFSLYFLKQILKLNNHPLTYPTTHFQLRS